MKAKTSLLGALVLLAMACNNQPDTPAVKNDDPHAGHQMAASPESDYAEDVNSGLIKSDTMKGSPHRVAMATVGGTHVHIEYSSPGVKGRTIWGGLVAWDQVWVAGAHQATSVRFYKDVSINNTHIPAGTYALFAIPGREEWTLILNSRYDQHLADEYNAAEDLIRVKLKPEAHNMMERLTYRVEPVSGDSGTIDLLWEKLKLSLPFKIL